MRLLQLCTRFPPGGIQRHVIDLAHGLRARGHYVAFAGSRGAWMNEEIDRDFFHIDVHNVAGEGGSTLRRLVTAVRSGWRLRTVVRRQQIELVHAHESAPALVAWIATRGLGRPVFVTFHGAEPERIGEFARIARMTADLVITPSHNSARDLREQGGMPADRLQVMGLGVQRKPAPDANEVAVLRTQLLGRDGRKLIVTVARLAHQKAIDTLIEAAKAAHLKDPGLRFVIVGDGPQRDDARRWVAEAGAGEYVNLIGHSDNAPLYLAAADLFFLPSRWESLPITIVEAFAHGAPVIATNTAGVVELVDDSVGRVVPIGDVSAMVAALLELSGDEPLRKRLSQAALARADEDRFSPPHVHAAFERLYQNVLSRPKWR